MPSVFITVNSPGEIDGWLKPVVKNLKELRSDLNITVFLTPCRYSSGQEENVIQNINEVDFVVNQKDFFRFLLGKSVAVDDKGVVLFLGGDLIFSLFLKWKMHWPVVAYTYRLKPWPWYKFFDRFFTRDDIGNLMVDAFRETKSKDEIYSKLEVDKGSKKIMFFPGSRRDYYMNFLSFIAKIGRIIKSIEPSFSLYIGLSPYVDRKITDQIFNENDFSAFTLIHDMDQDYLSVMDLLVTPPGTSTAGAAVKQIPMLVVLPFNKPEIIQYDGILGFIANTPYFGKYIKKIILPIMDKFIKYIALPNIEAKKTIVPEIRKVITEEEIAWEVVNLMKNKDKRMAMKEKLRGVMGNEGAVRKLCEEVLRLM